MIPSNGWNTLWRSEYMTYDGERILKVISSHGYEQLTRIEEWAQNASCLAGKSWREILTMIKKVWLYGDEKVVITPWG